MRSGRIDASDDRKLALGLEGDPRRRATPEKRYYYTTVSVFIRANSEDEAQKIAKQVEDACDRVQGVSSASVEDVTDETEDREA